MEAVTFVRPCLGDGAPAAEVLKHILPEGEKARFLPHHPGPGPGGGQFATAEMDTASSGDANPQGYATKLSAEEILKQAAGNKRTRGWLQPKDVKPGNERECVSLVRAVIPELPHSSQWQQGDPVTPENVQDLAPGTAIATFDDGRYSNAPHGNHAAIFLHADTRNGKEGIAVLDQFEGRYGDKGEAKERFCSFEPPPDSHYRVGAFSGVE